MIVNHNSDTLGLAGARSVKRVYLKDGDECVGIYERLTTSENSFALILSLANSQKLEISFPGGLSDEAVQNSLCGVEVGDRIGILRIDDKGTVILIRKLGTGKSDDKKTMVRYVPSFNMAKRANGSPDS